LAVILIGSTSASISASANAWTSMKSSPMIPAFGFYFLSIGEASCSLNTGVCMVTIANEGTNSSYDLVLAANYCNMDLIYAKNSTTTWYKFANGTAGGQIMNGLPHLTNVIATCTVPTSMLTYESNGSAADSDFRMKLVNNLGATPAGRTAYVHSDGTWTASPVTNTSTTTTTTTAQSTQTTSTTSTRTETTSETQTVTQTTTSLLGNSQSAAVILYGSAALIGAGVALAVLFIARRISKGGSVSNSAFSRSLVWASPTPPNSLVQIRPDSPNSSRAGGSWSEQMNFVNRVKL
jgi:hypothetical protein